MKYEIGSEAIVIEAGSHEFELGERMCTEFPENMWSVVSTDFNYLAIDEDGGSWFYEGLPWIEGEDDEGNGFWNGKVDKCEQNFIIPVSTSNWKMSVIKRPDNQK